jgi:hypothetical protein
MPTRVLPATSMLEAELSENVIALAHLFKWKVLLVRPARTVHGWRTPFGADGVGWPDLTLVRGDQLHFAELKSQRGRLTTEQQVWLDVLGKVGTVAVWRPTDWVSGQIEAVLRGRS